MKSKVSQNKSYDDRVAKSIERRGFCLTPALRSRNCCAGYVATVSRNTNGPVLPQSHRTTSIPLADQTALGRIGTPRDVAKVIVDLLSDNFGWVTAHDIDVSGGFLL
jgi:NAD(P)-dependent dehydrogenase (short-subunit alcohol dehydrogenase family)